MKISGVAALLLSFTLCASYALHARQRAQPPSLDGVVSGGIDEDLPPDADPPEALVVFAGPLPDTLPQKLSPLLDGAALLVADSQEGPQVRVDGEWQPLTTAPAFFTLSVGARADTVALFQLSLPDTDEQRAAREAALAARPEALSVGYLRWAPRSNPQTEVTSLHEQGIDLLVGDGSSRLIQVTDGRIAVHGLEARRSRARPQDGHAQLARLALHDTPDGVARRLEVYPLRPNLSRPLRLDEFGDAYWELLSANYTWDKHLKSRLRLQVEQPGRHYEFSLPEAP